MSIIVGTFNLVSIVGTFRGRLHWILCHQVYTSYSGLYNLARILKDRASGNNVQGIKFKMVTVPHVLSPRRFAHVPKHVLLHMIFFRVFWILAIIIFRVWKNVITIHVIGNLSLQFCIPHTHALIYACGVPGPTVRPRISV